MAIGKPSETRLRRGFGEASEAKAPPFPIRRDGGGAFSLGLAWSAHGDVRGSTASSPPSGTDGREVRHALGRRRRAEGGHRQTARASPMETWRGCWSTGRAKPPVGGGRRREDGVWSVHVIDRYRGGGTAGVIGGEVEKTANAGRAVLVINKYRDGAPGGAGATAAGAGRGWAFG